MSSTTNGRSWCNNDNGGSNQKAKKKPRLATTATATENDPPHRRKNDVVNTVEVDVDLPASIVQSDEVWTRTIVRHKRHTASYWPVVLIETCLAAHRYYMAGLQFAGPTAAAGDEAATPQPNLWILTESAAAKLNGGSVSCLGGVETMPFYYLNLIHCLPYGESWLLSGGNLDALTKTERQGMKSGTFPFQADSTWRRTRTTIHRTDATKTLTFSAKANRDDRLQDKKDILSRLKKRRIALVDASIAPIFKGGNRAFPKEQENRPSLLYHHLQGAPLDQFALSHVLDLLRQ